MLDFHLTRTSVEEPKTAQTQHAYLAVLPPILVFQFGSAALELRRSGLQGVSSVVQLRQLLVSLQDFVHIHTHDVHHLTDKNPHSSALKMLQLEPFNVNFQTIENMFLLFLKKSEVKLVSTPHPPALVSAADACCW